MKGRSNSRTLGSGIHCRCDSSSHAAEKSSRSVATASASTRKNRASKRRSRPGGVMARNTNCMALASGTCPVWAKLCQSSGGGMSQVPCVPRTRPVSSQSSRIAATAKAWDMSLALSWAIRSAQSGGIEAAKGISASARSTAPPGKTNLLGMKAALAPRWPIRIDGAASRSRRTITVAALRMAVLSTAAVWIVMYVLPGGGVSRSGQTHASTAPTESRSWPP